MLNALNIRLTVAAAALALLAGCAPAIQPPACPAAAASADERRGNAGCLIVNNGRILVLRHQPTGKIGLPGGTPQTAERAACTAHRETFEETGLTVEIGPFVAQMENGFLVYACQLADTGYAEKFAVPAHARREVREIFWASLDDQRAHNWRFPTQLGEIRFYMESVQMPYTGCGSSRGNETC
ncbi:MAG: NUDIX hydrolase [Gammaproteobacteria bacterium]|jgi:8-oxo-dGTP pyrophosphatase MutT (NUDIX family)|nr:NUDIX hydrolase [Gammaproteobacteria bacterium]